MATHTYNMEDVQWKKWIEEKFALYLNFWRQKRKLSDSEGNISETVALHGFVKYIPT